MPLWSVDIEKLLSAEHWTNRYIVDAADIQAAGAVAAQILQIERQVHRLWVTFSHYRVSDMVPNTDNYVVTPANVPGQWAASSGNTLPLWCVGVVDFSAATGRPSRKYIRSIFMHGDLDGGGQLNAATVAHFNSAYATPMANLQAYVDVDGQALISGAVKPYLGSRQLRRGSKRKLPII